MAESLKGNRVIGIRREDKNVWERRVPLTPDQVRVLVDQGIRVLVQPSNIRVFPNTAYAEAGAILKEDLSSANTILAVKEIPIHLLLPERTYAFFSHTIKAQPANMPLLDALLEKNIRMVDYECITVGGQRGGKRLVAFGRFAGIAGMVDFLRGLGERFLAMGYSTPFISVAAMYTYPDVASALAAVRAVGVAIRRYGIPDELCPLTITFTGDGNVSKGAQEVIAELGSAVKWLPSPNDLEGVVKTAAGSARTHTVYATVAKEEHMVQKRRVAASLASTTTTEGGTAGSRSTSHVVTAACDADAPFDKADYKAHPDAYEPVFHLRVIPFTSVLVNCMYWEPRFPRLLTIAQARELSRRGRMRLYGVCDITCDFEGSVEFLKEFTTIEAPFYVYDPEANSVHRGNMAAPGVLYHAVDHLPSECPRDASEHFGACLLPFLPALAASDGTKTELSAQMLPEEIAGAVLTNHGQLTPNFDYIKNLREAAGRAEVTRGLRASRRDSFVTLDLIGHLFDSGIINRVLDIVEDGAGSARILDFRVGRDRSTPTELRIQIFAPTSSTGTGLSSIIRDIGSLAASMGVRLSADSEDSYIHSAAARGALLTLPFARPALAPPKRILVLGAGFVSAPLVEYLLRRSANSLTVASVVASEAEALARGKPRVASVVLDVATQPDELSSLVAAHDLVVSLVPAACHAAVAKAAIAHRRNMVTASYISADVAALDAAAVDAGIIVLCEAGLDPGIDHMSAMQMIHAAADAGGTVTSFSSLCGGLPAPEAANNPLGYKFSWSPRGALGAARNAAQFRRNGENVIVPSEQLLFSASRMRVAGNPAFALEVLPNRDALPYAKKYGIDGPRLAGMFRGTLRYEGFSNHMAAIAALGLLESTPAPAPVRTVANMPSDQPPSMRDLLRWGAGTDRTASTNGCTIDDDDALFAAVVGRVKAAATAAGSTHSAVTDDTHASELRNFLTWVGLFDDSAPAPLRNPAPASHAEFVPIDTLVAILISKAEMSYAPGERDLALMQHEIDVLFPSTGRVERHTATLVEYAVKGVTAMSRTVGYTAAIAAQLILDGRVHARGVVAPLTREMYEPILEALAEEGIALAEHVQVLEVGTSSSLPTTTAA